jgi:hypothetical protein
MYMKPTLPTSQTGTQTMIIVTDKFRITGIGNEGGRSYWTPTKNVLHVFVFFKVGKGGLRQFM